MEATVSSKGQVVIPQKIRETFGITAGTSIDFIVQDNKIEISIVRKKTHTTLQDGFGLLKNKGRALPPDFDVATLLRTKK